MVINKTLDCGIRVVMEQIPYVKSVSIGIWVKAGAVDEVAKNSGISHFIEHMLFKGTEKRNTKQIAEDVDKIGGQINAFTGKEATCYYIKTLASNIEAACDILTDMFLNSKFDKIEMEKEKRVIYEEMKMIEDSPEDYAHDIIGELVFKDLPLSKSIIGTPSSLKGITQNAIRKYLNEEYTKDNIVISIAGNFDENEFCKLFEGKLKNLNPTKKVKEHIETEYKPGYKIKIKDVEQSHLCLGVKGIPLADDRYYSMSLLSNIMGGSMSSRLFQNIREEKGLAYSVYSMASSFSTAGYFNIYAGVSHDKVSDAICGIGEELQKLKNNGIIKDELSTAKEQLKSTYIFSQENVNSRMFANGKNTLILNKVFSQEEIISKIDSVTLDNLREVADIIADIRNYSAVLVGGKKIDLKKSIQNC
ncbi:M16 family metallopeptidase [Anaerovorax odorimutans]|uniref:M16 family metallopeptidase n=1 Tax=Anaerovorax odorimutans TaxID=109327 RepID=UPI0004043CF6|nr:pitrilysin family protein [Anaerovorax odorimutans]